MHESGVVDHDYVCVKFSCAHVYVVIFIHNVTGDVCLSCIQLAKNMCFIVFNLQELCCCEYVRYVVVTKLSTRNST